MPRSSKISFPALVSSGSGPKDATAFAFGAQFVEIRVHRRTRELQVARVVSAFAAGTIINAQAAHSQFMGDAIWGLSSIEVIIVPEQDSTVNPLGVKGIGEIGIFGMNAAVANAVFNATGKRVRELPIRPEKLL